MRLTNHRHKALIWMLAAGLWVPTAVRAQAPVQTPEAPVAAAQAWTEGEVRRVDRDNAKLTLRHAEIKNLNMPPMTMVFQVQNPADLEKLSVGSKVRFVAAQDGGRYIVTSVEPLER